MNKFQLVLMWEPMFSRPNIKGITNILPEITEGIESVLTKTEGDISFQSILNDIFAGKLLLWIAYNEGNYVGFVTTRIDEVLNAKKYLSLVHCFIKKGQPKTMFELGVKHLEDFGKKVGCDAMRLWTIRDGWEKRLIPLGWNQSYVEYNYPLKEAK